MREFDQCVVVCLCVFVIVTTLPSENEHVEEVVVTTTTTSETHAVVNRVDCSPTYLVISRRQSPSPLLQ